MALPSYVINFDELADMIELQLEDNFSRPWKDLIGEMKVKSFYIEIPAIVNRYRVLRWTAEENIRLTSVAYGQTAWKAEDSWTLYIRGEPMFLNVSTKELAEKKHWEITENLVRGETIELILNNSSGNHRGIWVEFSYIEMLGDNK